MKNKTHLLYGIIIGILLCACVGSSVEDQKEFDEIHLVRFAAKGPGHSGFYTYVNDILGPIAIYTYTHSPNEIRNAGYTILDYEIDQGHQYYLIGR